MPHITLQYTDNISPLPDFKVLFSTIHGILNNIAGIKIENCKSRAVPLSEYFIGEGKLSEGFIHLEVKILMGRSKELKSDLGKALLNELERTFLHSGNKMKLQITTEILDIDKDFYYKYPEL